MCGAKKNARKRTGEGAEQKKKKKKDFSRRIPQFPTEQVRRGAQEQKGQERFVSVCRQPAQHLFPGSAHGDSRSLADWPDTPERKDRSSWSLRSFLLVLDIPFDRALHFPPLDIATVAFALASFLVLFYSLLFWSTSVSNTEPLLFRTSISVRVALFSSATSSVKYPVIFVPFLSLGRTGRKVRL